MKNLYIFNFRQLPILATYFYNINNVNKTIILKKNDVYVKCKTNYKYINTNKCEGNTFVKSYLEIIYNSTYIEEECIYEDYEISKKLDRYHEQEINKYGVELLKKINEFGTIRALVARDLYFEKTILNETVFDLISQILGNTCILHLLNGIIIHPQITHRQSMFHRDFE